MPRTHLLATGIVSFVLLKLPWQQTLRGLVCYTKEVSLNTYSECA